MVRIHAVLIVFEEVCKFGKEKKKVRISIESKNMSFTAILAPKKIAYGRQNYMLN